ncbi:MAG: chloride channel protein [Rhodospirillales bacterium]|jgi:CIC family chloride channel protein|nr:chloride channel protein [Rhodospirillales bacterium]MDP6643065.1 chloride channel protein [Rhodospirillales bacterium]MDP6841029.1 chloride channel protein [Rhodospirillales bacterium]
MLNLPAIRPSRILMRMRRLVRNDQLILAVLAVVVGALAGLGTVVLRQGIVLVQSISFGTGAENLISYVGQLPWWHILLVTTFGGLVVGVFIHFAMPGRRPQGVAKVIEASALRGGRMSLRAGIGAAVASAASIGVGASVGREGPAVHLGSTLGAWVAEKLHLTRSLSRALLGCGAAAAVAASFNAPIAGALFAHEVVVGHFALSAFAPIVIASVVGTIVSRVVFGDFPAFDIHEQSLASFLEFPAVIGLGVLSGIMAIMFMRATMLTEDSAAKLPGPSWTRPAIGGFVVGLVAIVFPQILGVGYEATGLALQGQFPLALLIALVVVKTFTTAISIGTGFGGGVFTPSLMIGAMLGGAYGIVATSIFPELSSGAGAYTIIGMGAVAAAVLGAPISTTLIVFELTDDYPLTIAVMVAVVISSVITQQFQGKSFFNWQLERSGLDLKGGFEAALLRGLLVRRIMRAESETVSIGANLPEIRALLQDSETGELFVTKEDGALFGTITLHDLSDAAFDHDVDNLINAGDIARTDPPVLYAGDDLQTANKLIRDTGEHYIAIVESADNHKLVGTLFETDVMAAYNRALIEARHEEHDAA